MRQKKQKFINKRLNKLKKIIWSREWYCQIENKGNMLFKSNGIYCSCHRCDAARKMKKYHQSWWSSRIERQNISLSDSMKVFYEEMHDL